MDEEKKNEERNYKLVSGEVFPHLNSQELHALCF